MSPISEGLPPARRPMTSSASFSRRCTTRTIEAHEARSSTALKQAPQAANFGQFFDFEDRFDEARGRFTPEHGRDQVTSLVDDFVAAHRVARRTTHRRDTL